jgi:hypothetical protein
MRTEQWREVPCAPAYEVSSLGRVRRKPGTYGCRDGRILRLRLNRHGYLVIALSLGTKGRYRHVGVHTLMAESFLGPRPTPQHEVAHRDGDRQHNVLSNIRWATPAENAQDREAHGHTARPKGELHGQAVLTAALVREMRVLKREGCTVDQLAARFGVSRWTIFDALSGRTWGHVNEPTVARRRGRAAAD